MITPEDEIRYGLRPLPVVEPMSVEEARQRNEAYTEHRRAYRRLHPDREKTDER